MSGEIIHKFIYEDNNITKVLKGQIIKEDEFTFSIQSQHTNEIVIIGKRAIIKVSQVGGAI